MTGSPFPRVMRPATWTCAPSLSELDTCGNTARRSAQWRCGQCRVWSGTHLRLALEHLPLERCLLYGELGFVGVGPARRLDPRARARLARDLERSLTFVGVPLERNL
eukprot:7379555-Prymnesium_polylepis.2